MKKIGIITISRTNNFGAELQAFALQMKLRTLGYSAEVIDYLYYKHKKHKPSNDSKSEISFSYKDILKKKLLYRIIGPVINVVLPLFHPPTRRRLQNFTGFHVRNTKFSSQFRSIQALYAFQHQYDVFITGSDQVWNPATFTSLKPYFLDFAPKAKIKMSYAASFGVSAIDKKYHNIYRKWIGSLNHISVRETQGKVLVKKLTGRDATVVLDPTLLLKKNDWREVIVGNIENRPEKYILIYELHPSDFLMKKAHELGELLGLPIIKLCKQSLGNKKYKGIRNIVDAGPSEFIELFYDASFVITNSFHGTVFSTNFNIPFYAVLNEKRKNNSRMTSFLSRTGLENRIIWEHKSSGIDNCMKIDFEGANKTLDKLRLESFDFLKSSIESQT